MMSGLKSLAKEGAIEVGLALATGGTGNVEEAGIEITGRGLEHVLERHYAEGALSAGKSLFNSEESVQGLVRLGEKVPAVKQAAGRNFQRIVNAGREIGVDRATGQATSTYTIITNAANQLVTMFPGIP